MIIILPFIYVDCVKWNGWAHYAFRYISWIKSIGFTYPKKTEWLGTHIHRKLLHRPSSTSWSSSFHFVASCNKPITIINYYWVQYWQAILIKKTSKKKNSNFPKKKIGIQPLCLPNTETYVNTNAAFVITTQKR